MAEALVSDELWAVMTGPNPTDRGELGSKRHLLVDAGGISPAAP